MKSPFKFLDSFTKDDREIFFGRDREIEELYQRVFDSKLLLVYGVSGTGKSSLIHCGLANKFRETDWLPLVVRRGGNIIEGMSVAIKTASITKQEGRIVTPGNFKKCVKSLYLDHYKPIFFLFDQFEELFIFGDKEEKNSFVQVIKSLLDSDIQCRLIFILREEYMANITAFERHIPTIFSNRVHIEKMSHRNAVEAITGPCKVFNISLEEGFTETLLEKLSPGSIDIELTYLQVFLDKIFRLALKDEKPASDQANPSFTITLLEQTGDVSDLLGGFLDEQISLLEAPETALAILKSLVSVKGTKRPMSPEEIREYSGAFGKPIEETVLVEMLQTFIHLRILRDKDQNGKYELRHDALAVKIYEKFTLVEKELLEVRKYVENAFYSFETRGIMLNKQDLEYLAAYDRKLVLPQNLADFVEQSKYKLLSQKRAFRRITSFSAVILVLILAAMVRSYLVVQKNTKANDLIASALLQSGTNPARGILTTLNLWEKDSTSTLLHYIILNDFQSLISMRVDSTNPVALLQKNIGPVKLMSNIVNADISKDGRYIFGWLDNKQVFILNLITYQISYFKSNGDPEHIEFSEKDSCFALVYRNNKGAVCDFSGNLRYHFETTLNDVMNERLVCFFPSGDYQLVAAKDNSALIYNKTGKIVSELKGHSARVNSVDVSSDGRFIATASSDKRVFLWNFNQTTEQISIYDSLKGHYSDVWSCEFNGSGKYVITASADSTIKVWNLNGRQINPSFFFAKNYSTGSRSRKNKREPDEDTFKPDFSTYYRKFCNASFSKDGREIVATGYTVTPDSSLRNATNLNKVLFYDRISIFGSRENYAFFAFAKQNFDSLVPEPVNQLVISPCGDLAVTENYNSKTIKIIAAGGLCLSTLEGRFPNFSKDGTELFWVWNNQIRRMPVRPGTIKDLLQRYKITGSTSEAEDIIIVL